MKMAVCRGCGVDLTPENDSEAHIIPNALGGHLKPKGIICRECNGKLDKIADNALVQAFGDWPTLLDLPRDRGINPPKLIQTHQGRRVRLQPDGSMTSVDVKYDVKPIPGGHEVEISAGDMKTIRNLLKRVEKEFPNFDPKAAEQYAQTRGIEGDDPLIFRLDFSPRAVMGGIITAIWLYLIKTTGRSFMDWDHLLKCIADMQANAGTFRYFVTEFPGLRGPKIDLCHKIIVRSNPATGELITFVEILGVLKVGGLFAKSPPPAMPLEHIYVYDLSTKTDRSAEFSIDADEFNKQNWSTIGLGAHEGDALRGHFKTALEIFADYYRRRFTTT